MYCCAFDLTGRRIFTGSDDANIKVWCALTGMLQHTLRGHSAEITEMVISPCNRWLVSASIDGTARVWCTRTGEPEAILARHRPSPVNSVAFAPSLEAHTLVTIGQDASVYLWDSDDWMAPPVVLRAAPVAALAVHANGVLAGYEPAAAPPVLPPKGKSWPRHPSSSTKAPPERRPLAASATNVAISPTGRTVAVGISAPPYLLIWPTDGGASSASELRVCGHADEVTTACFSHRGDCLLTGSHDGTARVWHWRGRLAKFFHTKLLAPEAARLKSHESGLNAHSGAKPLAVWIDMVAWSADDRYIFTSESLRKQTQDQPCVSSCVRVWQLSERRGGGGGSSVGGGGGGGGGGGRVGGGGGVAVPVAPSGREVVLVHTLQPASSTQPIFVMQPHPLDTLLLATAGYDGYVRVWDLYDGTQIGRMQARGPAAGEGGDENHEEPAPLHGRRGDARCGLGARRPLVRRRQRER